MTLKLKIIIILIIIWWLLLHMILPIYFIIGIIEAVGTPKFNEVCILNSVLIFVSILLYRLNVPQHIGWFALSKEETDWLAGEVKRIKEDK